MTPFNDQTAVVDDEGVEFETYCFGSGAGGALGLDEKGNLRKIATAPVVITTTLKLLVASSNFAVPPIVSAGENVSSVLTERGQLYAWGQISMRSERPNPDLVAIPQVKKVNHGPNQSAVAIADGKAYHWNTSRPKPRQVSESPEAPARYIDVACSSKDVLLLKSTGDVVKINLNGSICRPRARATQIGFAGTKIEKIDCGPNHSAAISICGRLFTWGWGESGRLGHGDEEPRASAELVKSIARQGTLISAVACGAAHTCVVTNYGSVWGFGLNAYGQVGVSSVNGACLLPQEVLVGYSILDISAGFGHTAAVSDQGHLFSWGFNEEGQLGLGHEESVDTPTLVDTFPDQDSSKYVLKVSCGHLHTLCVTSNQTHAILELLIKQSKAKVIILRFARFILLKVRLHKHSLAAAAKATSIDESKTSDYSSLKSEIRVTDSSDDQTIESGDSFMQFNKNGSNEEEESSHLASVLLGNQAIQQYQKQIALARDALRHRLVQAKEEAPRLEEITNSKEEEEEEEGEEDIRARSSVEAYNSRVDLLDKQVSKRNKEIVKQKNADREERVRASIEREANRLKEARQRKLLQSSANMTLPEVRRKKLDPSALSTRGRRNQKEDNWKSHRQGISKLSKKKTKTRTNELLECRKKRLDEKRRVDEQRQIKALQEAERRLRLDDSKRQQLVKERGKLEMKRRQKIGLGMEELRKKLGLGNSEVCSVPGGGGALRAIPTLVVVANASPSRRHHSGPRPSVARRVPSAMESVRLDWWICVEVVGRLVKKGKGPKYVYLLAATKPSNPPSVTRFLNVRPIRWWPPTQLRMPQCFLRTGTDIHT